MFTPKFGSNDSPGLVTKVVRGPVPNNALFPGVSLLPGDPTGLLVLTPKFGSNDSPALVTKVVRGPTPSDTLFPSVTLLPGDPTVRV